jgi:hypothetical protein
MLLSAACPVGVAPNFPPPPPAPFTCNLKPTLRSQTLIRYHCHCTPQVASTCECNCTKHGIISYEAECPTDDRLLVGLDESTCMHNSMMCWHRRALLEPRMLERRQSHPPSSPKDCVAAKMEDLNELCSDLHTHQTHGGLKVSWGICIRER